MRHIVFWFVVVTLCLITHVFGIELTHTYLLGDRQDMYMLAVTIWFTLFVCIIVPLYVWSAHERTRE
jgi:uncharacterized membrane protein